MNITRHSIRTCLLAVAIGASLIGTATPAASTPHFGIYSMSDGSPAYQAIPGYPSCGWKTTLGGTPNTLTYNFAAAMASYATRDYWWYLPGDAYYWEDSGNQVAGAGINTVDLLFALTHGQVGPRSAIPGGCGYLSDPADSSTHATWAMWGNPNHARSDYMRLGIGTPGLSIFSTYSCDTLKPDGSLWTRWQYTFSGGLRIATGFGDHGYWYANDAQYQHGARYATYLGAGQQVLAAWLNAFDDNDGLTFPPIAMVTGNGDSDGYTRANTMTFYNFNSIPRLTSFSGMYFWYWSNAD